MQTKDILKELRKSKGYNNAKDFCEASGISYNTYQNYETGKRLPTAEFLMQIADFYGVTTDYLLGREPAQPEPNPFADLGLDKESEQEMLAQYMSFPPETRAILMDALVQLASVVKPNEPETIRQSTMIDCGTVDEELERRARQKDTA
jgi:transcriptional regulator with XRE-family HTH domain